MIERRRSSDYDVMMLQFVHDANETFVPVPYTNLEDGMGGWDVSAFGFPPNHLGQPLQRRGTIGSTSPTEEGLIDTTAQTRRGMGGGPVVLDTGELIGIVAGSEYDSQTGEVASYLVLAAESFAPEFRELQRSTRLAASQTTDTLGDTATDSAAQGGNCAAAIQLDESNALAMLQSCLAGLELRFSQQPGTTAASTQSLPPGLVVASLHECSSLRGGWSDFYEGRGRMIVGAGDHGRNPFAGSLTTRPVYSAGFPPSPDTLGGEERVALESEQMPVHHHKLIGQSDDAGDTTELTAENQIRKGAMPRGGHDPWYILRGHDVAATLGRSSPEGGSKAHSNMPPYIALYLCKKD